MRYLFNLILNCDIVGQFLIEGGNEFKFWQVLSVLENKVDIIRKIFGAKEDEVTREWRNIMLSSMGGSPDNVSEEPVT